MNNEKQTVIGGAASDTPTLLKGIPQPGGKTPTVFLMPDDPECMAWLSCQMSENSAVKGTLFILDRRKTAIKHGTPYKSGDGTVLTHGLFQVNDPFVSSDQGAIEFVGKEGWFLHHNLLATNPTSVNGTPVSGKAQLHNGDRIKFGRSWFVFKCLTREVEAQ